MRAALEEILPGRETGGSRPAAPGAVALLCTALLMAGAAWLLWQTKIWRDLAAHVRAVVIGFAAPVDAAAAERIVLVDISRLKPKTQAGDGGEVNATPRDKLLALITAIGAARPQAIAVDIDFSPLEDHPEQPYTPEDPNFLRALLRLRAETGIPVFAGVWRHDAGGREQWLGGAEFAPLAAGLGIAREEEDPVERLPLTFVSAADGATLPSLSLVLAQAGGATAPEDGAAAWFRRRVTGPYEAGPVTVTEYTANFTALAPMIKQRVSGSTPEEIPGLREHLHGKLVLLSDADLSQRADPFTLPAHRNEPVPGGYVHACGTASLLSGAPAALTTAGRFLAGAGFIALLMGGFALVERRVRLGRGRINEKFAGRAAVLAAVALAVILFMRLGRLAWTDVIYLSAGLLLLQPLARHLSAAAKGISTAWRKGLYSLGIGSGSRMVAGAAANPRTAPKKPAPKKNGFGRRGGRESATEEMEERIVP